MTHVSVCAGIPVTEKWHTSLSCLKTDLATLLPDSAFNVALSAAVMIAETTAGKNGQ